MHHSVTVAAAAAADGSGGGSFGRVRLSSSGAGGGFFCPLLSLLEMELTELLNQRSTFCLSSSFSHGITVIGCPTTGLRALRLKTLSTDSIWTQKP